MRAAEPDYDTAAAWQRWLKRLDETPWILPECEAGVQCSVAEQEHDVVSACGTLSTIEEPPGESGPLCFSIINS